MKTLKVANGVLVYRLEWNDGDLLAWFDSSVFDSSVYVVDDATDVIFDAFRTGKKANVAYHEVDGLQTVVYSELS